MKKIIKLNESDLLKIINRIISEQYLREPNLDLKSIFGYRARKQLTTIEKIQTQLNKVFLKDSKWIPLEVDGVYGNTTRAAVRKFQLDNKPLIPDGIVGPSTAEVLGVDPLSKEQQGKLKRGITIQDKQPPKLPKVKPSPSKQTKTKTIKLWPELTPEYSNQITAQNLKSKKLPHIEHSGCAGFLNQISKPYVSGNAWQAYHYMKGDKIWSAFNKVNPESYEDVLDRIKRKGVEDNEDTKENQEIRKIVQSLNGFTGKLQLGDRVGIFFKDSKHYEKALVDGIKAAGGGKPTFNTHTGIVGAMVDGEPIIFHAVNGQEIADPASSLKILWVKRGGL
jgi:murein L,D-transpeptidase YcbB/YkuD